MIYSGSALIILSTKLQQNYLTKHYLQKLNLNQYQKLKLPKFLAASSKSLQKKYKKQLNLKWSFLLRKSIIKTYLQCIGNLHSKENLRVTLT